MSPILSREVEIDLAHTAVLFIDVQNYVATENGGEYTHMEPADREAKLGFFFRTMQATAVPNMQRLQTACRQARIEVLYTVIESMTQDGRDNSLDYKISGLVVPKGSWDAKVIDEIAPTSDEMVFPKTSSSVFISTNIDYVLRNLGVRSLIIAGVLTDQCVDSAVRDACDLGYLVTTPTDSCATLSQERHDWSLRNAKGYSRQILTADLVAEIERLGKPTPSS